MSDETIKRVYNTFEDVHKDPIPQQDLDHPVLGGVDKLDIAPADRHVLEEEYGSLTATIDAYQMAAERVNEFAKEYYEHAKSATEALPEEMVRDSRSTELVYEKDGSEHQIRSRTLFRHLEENLRGHDERMLADYIAQEFEDGKAMVASWEEAAEDWNRQLYAAAEQESLPYELKTVRTALGQYKQQGNMLRRELETAMEPEDEPGLLDKVRSLNPFADGDLYY